MSAHAWFLLPVLALAAGVLALAPLGTQVLARGVVFIDLAVAQAAAAAALAATTWLDHPPTWQVQIAAAAGALACAALVAGLARRWPAQREALIGLSYVAGASLAMLAARGDPHGREHLSALLAADVLWAGGEQLAWMAACAVAVAALQAAGGGRLSRDAWFFPLFAIVASLAVPVLGLFVVFAALIAPALWQHRGSSAAVARAGAVVATGAGLAASWVLDAPSGVCVALALALFGGGSVIGTQARSVR
jgi:zinc/manganese transport system permease protein